MLELKNKKQKKHTLYSITNSNAASFLVFQNLDFKNINYYEDSVCKTVKLLSMDSLFLLLYVIKM